MDEFLEEFEKASLIELPSKTGTKFLQKIEKAMKPRLLWILGTPPGLILWTFVDR